MYIKYSNQCNLEIMIITIVIILIFIIREEKHKMKLVNGLTNTLNDLFGIFDLL